MRTQMMIIAIVMTILVAALAVLAGLVQWLGWLAGTGTWLGVLAVLIAVYLWVVKPWHVRWGATDDEVNMTMAGDDLIPGANPASRAITIEATPEEIWPWLVQLGYGKAGWYSYDWIDNDFQPSADRIIAEWQNLEIGDKILMMPGMGFDVVSIDPPRSIVSVLEDGSTSWCLALYPDNGGTRLVSRWRAKFVVTPANVLMIALTEPGSFIMEQKMLRTVRDRVQSAPSARPSRVGTA